MNQFILAVDQGTTSSRALIFDADARMVAMAQKEFTQHYPQSGWVEHDATEIWSTQAAVCVEAMHRAGINHAQIMAMGITNQRETTVVWDKHTGQPVYNAIVWQDRRTAAFCENLRKQGYGDVIAQKTGLRLDAYFSATKIDWILTHVPGARAKAEAGDLLFGTIDCWLIWKFTGGKVHATDITNASRTLLLNIHTGTWDEELLKVFNIPASMLPKVVQNAGIVGHTADYGIPISGIAGDQQAALFGQLCIHPGMVKNTYGTGCFMMMNTGAQPIQSAHDLLTTVAYTLNGVIHYALEGSIFIGGAVIQWLRDGLHIIQQAREAEALAQTVPDNGDVYFVPALTGLGAPHWDPYARGAIVGISRGTTAGHITRAALESIAFQSNEVMEAMQKDAQLTVHELRVDGGATANRLLMQFQADISNTLVTCPQILETTALGAAFFAGLGICHWSGVQDLQAIWSVEQSFTSQMQDQQRQHLLARWHDAVGRSKHWAQG